MGRGYSLHFVINLSRSTLALVVMLAKVVNFLFKQERKEPLFLSSLFTLMFGALSPKLFFSFSIFFFFSLLL